MSATRLPVEEVLPELLQKLAAARAAVLEAPPGAGKTTLVPPALLQAEWLSGSILMLQPRRVAALASARRMARMMGEEPGNTVGYAVRYERKVSSCTRIEVVTEGILTRRLQSDPSLEGVGVVIFDEFHERNLHSDLALALCREAQAALRPDLRIVVMSATLEVEPIARLLDAPVVRSGGTLHPVEVRYLEGGRETRIAEAVAAAVRTAAAETTGDILAFLPGVGEITRCRELLRSALPEDILLCSLYGDLPLQEQERALLPAPRRKVILSTDVAETSLTIEGVRTVVDSGWRRTPLYDPASGLTRLATIRVSAASARQRAGRAGRTSPGVCYRLWSPHVQSTLVPHHAPEIANADLSALVLELALWGVSDPSELTWLDPPSPAAVAEAKKLLSLLGALDGGGRITATGRRIASLGIHPRLGRLIAAAVENGVPGLGCDIAALLAERDILRRGTERPLTDSDIFDRLELLDGFRTRRPEGIVDPGACAAADRLSRHLRRQAGVRGGDESFGPAETAALLLHAYPDRIAGRREGGEERYLLSSGRGASVSPRSSVRRAPLLVAPLVEEGEKKEGLIHAAAVVTAEQVRRVCRVERVSEAVWDDAAGRVAGREEERAGRVVLSVRTAALSDGEALPILLQALSRRGLAALGWNPASLSFLHRVRFLGRLFPGEWPDLSDEALLSSLGEWLGPFLGGVRSLEEACRKDLLQPLKGMLERHQPGRLQEGAPETIAVPSGSRIRISYEGEEPVLAVKLQELFGLADTPRIAWGRVPLLLHLLSPAGRPIQVTRDLKGFWNGAYHQVKKELKGRYPKHPWPDDPWTATATRHAKRRQ